MDKNTKQPKNLDEIYKSIKSYGYYQMFFLAVMQYGCWIDAGNRAAENLGQLIPTYKCFDKNLEFELNSTQIHLNARNACRLIRACQNLTLEKAWTSLYEEFEWFCESDSLKSTLPTLLPFANLLSFVIAGHLSDYLGRKWLIISGYSVKLLCGFLQALAPNMSVYMSIIVIKTFARSLCDGAAFVLAIESVHSKYRLIQAFGFQFSIGYMLAGLTSYLTGHWRRQLLLINFLGIPLLFIKLLKLEESPRFLIQKQKYTEAAMVLNRIAKFNGFKHVYFTQVDLQEIQISTKCKQECKKKYSILYLFSCWTLSLYAISQIFTGFTINIVTGAIFANFQDLALCPFVNMGLLGLLRLWTPFVGVALENGSKCFGRKKLMVVSQGMVALCFVIMFVIDLLQLDEKLRIVGTISALLGHALETGIVWIAYKLYSTELFPTVIRTIALTTFSSTSLLGFILSPQLVYLKRYWHPTPFFVAAISAVLSTILSGLILPETKFVALPDTIDEAIKREELPCEENEDNQKFIDANEKINYS